MTLIRANNRTLTDVTAAGLPSGTVLQVKQATATGEATKSDITWVDSGLFTGVTFDNALQSGSKVFCTIEATVSEAQAGAWAVPCCLTLYEGSTNIGDSTFGIVAGHGVDEHSANAQYTMERLYGSLLYTPTATNPSYKLYMRTNNTSGFNRTIGSANNTDSRYNVGGTRITLMEIAG